MLACLTVAGCGSAGTDGSTAAPAAVKTVEFTDQELRAARQAENQVARESIRALTRGFVDHLGDDAGYGRSCALTTDPLFCEDALDHTTFDNIDALKSYVEELIDAGGIVVRTDTAQMGTAASGLAYELVDTERVAHEWRIVMDQDRLKAAQAAQERGDIAP